MSLARKSRPAHRTELGMMHNGLLRTVGGRVLAHHHGSRMPQEILHVEFHVRVSDAPTGGATSARATPDGARGTRRDRGRRHWLEDFAGSYAPKASGARTGAELFRPVQRTSARLRRAAYPTRYTTALPVLANGNDCPDFPKAVRHLL